MTQKELLESVLYELKHIKTNMPNGELKQMVRDLDKLKEDVSDLKYTLLNPDDGVIVNTNKNTDFRRELERDEKERQARIAELEELRRWKSSVSKALWIIFGSLVAIVSRILMMHSGQ